MQLSEQQKQTVREWVASGASLSDVQRNLKTELGITMTFIDVRLLVLDLGAAIKDKPEAKPAKPLPTPEQHDREEEAISPPEFDEEPPHEMDAQPHEQGAAEGEQSAGCSVTLTMDHLVVPGSMVSGTVTFSDGTKARWMIDQYGRFGLDPETPGYQPSPPDLQEFQNQLRNELQRKGYV